MSGLSGSILNQMKKAEMGKVWVPSDFLSFGAEAAVYKTLQRLEKDGKIRRLSKGLYDFPISNPLTGELSSPHYQSIAEAMIRRDHCRLLLDGMTSANDLGLTTAVPGKVIFHTDGRFRPIQVGNLVIHFKKTAASKLYWAGHPAMKIIQALYWLRDQIQGVDPKELSPLRSKLLEILKKPKLGDVLCQDLEENLQALPFWMRSFVTDLLREVHEKH